MSKIVFTLQEDEHVKINQKAKSLGLTVTAYVRNVVKQSLQRNSETKHNELICAIKAIIPTMAEALGRTQGASEEDVEKLIKVLLERYNREIK